MHLVVKTMGLRQSVTFGFMFAFSQPFGLATERQSMGWMGTQSI